MSKLQVMDRVKVKAHENDKSEPWYKPGVIEGLVVRVYEGVNTGVDVEINGCKASFAPDELTKIGKRAQA